MEDRKHCDDLIRDKSQPKCLRKFLLFHRIPAVWQLRWLDRGWPEPSLFAMYLGERVRVVMASRFGDVGISRNLDQPHGYFSRVGVDQLCDFSERVG